MRSLFLVVAAIFFFVAAWPGPAPVVGLPPDHAIEAAASQAVHNPAPEIIQTGNSTVVCGPDGCRQAFPGPLASRPRASGCDDCLVAGQPVRNVLRASRAFLSRFRR